MKNLLCVCIAMSVTVVFLSCSGISKTAKSPQTFQPDDQKLYDTILHLDSLFFDSYNNCSTKLEQYGSFYADDVEFYHDKGGLSTSKTDLIIATQKNICGKVTRELLKETVEVYPVKNFGAIEIGYHKFHNNTEKTDTVSRPGRFVIVWEDTKNGWKIKRVVSLH